MEDEKLAERVTELEVKLTYQDRLIAELDQVVIELRAEVERLVGRTRRLEQQLREGLPDGPDDGPPPHY